MPCGPRCFNAATSRSTCRCSCGGARHGQGNVPAGTATDVAGRPLSPAADGDPSEREGEGEGRLRVNVGVTPYRGQPRETREAIDAYYETSRWRGFERRVHDDTQARGLELESIDRADGFWEGSAEPSASVWIRGEPSAVADYSEALRARYNQDGVVTFTPDNDGDTALHTLRGVRDVEHARELLVRYDVLAARVRGDCLEIISDNQALDETVNGIAHELGAGHEYTRGRMRLFEKE